MKLVQTRKDLYDFILNKLLNANATHVLMTLLLCVEVFRALHIDGSVLVSLLQLRFRLETVGRQLRNDHRIPSGCPSVEVLVVQLR